MKTMELKKKQFGNFIMAENLLIENLKQLTFDIMQEGWAHVCPFIMWCHEKKKLCSLAAVKAEKRQKKRA
uniref:Uncharacterized protein n=1 Tax=Daphnia galeata TaxID=27404 RepID=A0A8J2RL73_9CRUS|nr:unnamed protein product [Daphnia galeata]